MLHRLDVFFLAVIISIVVLVVKLVHAPDELIPPLEEGRSVCKSTLCLPKFFHRANLIDVEGPSETIDLMLEVCVPGQEQGGELWIGESIRCANANPLRIEYTALLNGPSTGLILSLFDINPILPM